MRARSATILVFMLASGAGWFARDAMSPGITIWQQRSADGGWINEAFVADVAMTDAQICDICVYGIDGRSRFDVCGCGDCITTRGPLPSACGGSEG